MKVDLERLRAKAGWVGWRRVPLERAELSALLAVVDAARAVQRVRVYGHPDKHALYVALEPLLAALEPFAPRYDETSTLPPARAWEEVDRWNAQQERDLAVKAAVDATKPNPRDRARDQLADAGVVVQRQFRSDQERIAELERERDALRKELDARRADVRELETDAAASAGERGEMEERIAELERELAEARKEREWAREETKLTRAGRLPVGRGSGSAAMKDERIINLESSLESVLLQLKRTEQERDEARRCAE